MQLYNDYGDLENGFNLEIMVTNHCNLNCMGCDHFAPVSEPWFLEKESLEKQLQILLKQKMDTKIKNFFLLGGEPFLNSEIFDFIVLIKKYFPKSGIDILTNGILLNTLSHNNLELLKKNNAHISITHYPINYDYEKISNQLSKYEIDWTFLHVRAIFQQSLINPSGTGNKYENFEKCGRHRFPVLTLQDYKIFFCPDACCIPHIKDLNITNTKNDYLSIYNLTIENLKKYCSTPKDICAYCELKQYDAIIWNHHKNISEYYYTLKDYYLYDYNTYLEIINNEKYANIFFGEDFYIKKIDPVYCSNYLYKYIYQYKMSKIDIIIPFYSVDNNIMEQLKKELLNQTLISECVIYFISDNSPYEEEMFNFFHYINELNCVFLKNEKRMGPGAARNIGIKYAKGEYLYFLDVDDGFFENNTLEKMYQIIKKDESDVLSIPVLSDISNKKYQSGSRLLVSNLFIKKYKILYPNIYINEDGYFIWLIESYNPKNIKLQNIYYKYNKNLYDNNIGRTIGGKFISILLASASNYYQIKQYNYDVAQQVLNQLINQLNLLEEFSNNPKEELNIEFGEALAFFILNEIYLLEPNNKIILDNKNNKIIKKIIMQDYNIILNNHKTYDWLSFKNKILSILKKDNRLAVSSACNLYLNMI